MKVFCYAYENMYQGLHGIESGCVMEVDDNPKLMIQEIEEWAIPEIEYLIDWVRNDEYGDDEEEYDYWNEELDGEYEWYKIKDEFQNLSVNELDNAYNNEGYKYFVKKYCEVN